MLLVDDDEAEVLHRREDGAADADADAGLAASQPPPLRVALARRRAPLWSTATSSPKRARKRPDELRGERDLGHEHERALAGGARARDRPEVDLGLARAGDAVEQEGLEGAEGAGDAGERVGLRRREGERRPVGGEEPAAGHRRLAIEPHEPPLRQRLSAGRPCGNAAFSSSTGIRPRARRYSRTAFCARARPSAGSASAAPGSGVAYSTPRRAGAASPPRVLSPGGSAARSSSPGGTR